MDSITIINPSVVMKFPEEGYDGTEVEVGGKSSAKVI